MSESDRVKRNPYLVGRCFTWHIRLAPEHIELLHKLVSKEYSGWFTGGDVPKTVEELANDVEELYNATIGNVRNGG